jgi:hypothetical protein
LVQREFPRPKFGVGLGHGQVADRAVMPETSVDRNRQSDPGESYVETEPSNPIIYPVTSKPFDPKAAPQSHFELGILAFVRPHGVAHS